VQTGERPWLAAAWSGAKNHHAGGPQGQLAKAPEEWIDGQRLESSCK